MEVYDLLQPQYCIAVATLCFILIWCVRAIWEWYGTEKYPFATLGDEDPLESWVKNGTQLIEEGLRKFPGPFHIRTGTGPKLIVRNRCAQEFAKHPALSVAEALRSDSFADYPGFEAAKVSVHSQVVRDTLLRRVTPALDSLRGKLVADAEVSILENFGESSEWTTASVQPLILDVVAKMSSRPFVGDRLCRDPEWLEVQKQYAGLSAVAASELRNCSVLFRRVRHWMLPSCRSLRRLVRDARALYAKEMRVRSESTSKSIGDTDSISWLEKESRVSNVHVDIVAAQLQLSMVAIQTTSHVLCHALLHACEHSKFIEPLRNEAIEVIGKYGWSKAGLYHLKLMDCFLKESLRVSQGRLAMARVATEKIVFSDGTVVPKGTGCMLEANFQHENPYAYPEHFDPSRYAQMRNEAGETQSWQYVSSSPDDQGFGYGLHSCPGKFFANNVVKVAFAHLLMFYDWSLDSNDENHTLEAESVKTVNPNFQLRFRRRKSSAQAA